MMKIQRAGFFIGSKEKTNSSFTNRKMGSFFLSSYCFGSAKPHVSKATGGGPGVRCRAPGRHPALRPGLIKGKSRSHQLSALFFFACLLHLGLFASPSPSPLCSTLSSLLLVCRHCIYTRGWCVTDVLLRPVWSMRFREPRQSD